MKSKSSFRAIMFIVAIIAASCSSHHNRYEELVDRFVMTVSATDDTPAYQVSGAFEYDQAFEQITKLTLDIADENGNRTVEYKYNYESDKYYNPFATVRITKTENGVESTYATISDGEVGEPNGQTLYIHTARKVEKNGIETFFRDNSYEPEFTKIYTPTRNYVANWQMNNHRGVVTSIVIADETGNQSVEGAEYSDIPNGSGKKYYTRMDMHAFLAVPEGFSLMVADGPEYFLDYGGVSGFRCDKMVSKITAANNHVYTYSYSTNKKGLISKIICQIDRFRFGRGAEHARTIELFYTPSKIPLI